MSADRTLGFIGAGAMAEALIQGVLAAGWTKPGHIHLTDQSTRARLAALAPVSGCGFTRGRNRSCPPARRSSWP